MRRFPLLVAAIGASLGAALLATCDGRRDAVHLEAAAPSATAGPARARPRARAAEPFDAVPETPPAAPSAETRGSPDASVTTVFPEGATVAQPEHTLRGRVVDADGRPIAGADVTLVSCWLPRTLVDDRVEIISGQCRLYVEYPHVESRVATGASGEFALTYREGGERRLYVERGERLAAIVDEPPGAAPLEIRAFEPPPALEVRVIRDADGTPVPGAAVSLRQLWLDAHWLYAWASVPDPPGADATTDADGRCRFDDRTAGPAALFVTAPGFAPAVGRRAVVPATGTATHEVRLSPGYTLTGRIVDAETGAPLAGAEVRADPKHVRDDTTATSGADGRFRIEHVEAASSRSPSIVEARAAGFAVERLRAGSVDAAHPACDVTIAMHRAADLRVRCTDGAGAPLDGVIVAATSISVAGQTFGGGVADRAAIEDASSADSEADGLAVVASLHPGAADTMLALRFYVDGVPVFERTYPRLVAGEHRNLGDVVVTPARAASEPR